MLIHVLVGIPTFALWSLAALEWWNGRQIGITKKFAVSFLPSVLVSYGLVWIGAHYGAGF